MHHPNQILGAERTLGIGGGLNDACGAQACNMSTDSYRDRTPTISTTLEVRADCDFSAALNAVIHGHRITRAGWNGRGQYVTAQRPDKHSKMTAPYLCLKNSQDDLVPWVPSQGDLFARDWAVLPIQLL